MSVDATIYLLYGIRENKVEDLLGTYISDDIAYRDIPKYQKCNPEYKDYSVRGYIIRTTPFPMKGEY